jgi:hypothetical protein
VVCVFARKTSEPLTSLVKQIDEKLGKDAELKSFVVVLTQADDAADIKHVPLTLHQDPGEVPSYEIAKEADFTILMWKKGKVKVNHAYNGDLTDKQVTTIVADIAKLKAD